MKLYVAPRAPSPRRVMMFVVEKNITGIELINVDLNAQEHKAEAYRAISPLAKVPALELHDGRVRLRRPVLERRRLQPFQHGPDLRHRLFLCDQCGARSLRH